MWNEADQIICVAELTSAYRLPLNNTCNRNDDYDDNNDTSSKRYPWT